MMNDIRHEKMFEAAVWHCDAGHSVIPVQPNKKPLIDWKKYQTERASREEIASWFQKWPNMNIGIVTGKISSIVVVDIEKGGDPKLWPQTLVAKTGGGGLHLYYKYPGHHVNNGVRVTEKTDIRGDGGYVLSPPSISEKGEYKWAHPIDKIRMTDYPENVIASLPNSIEQKPDETEMIPVGQRNDTATRYVGRIFSQLSSDQWETGAWGALKEFNATKMEQPLDEKELRSVYESIRSRERMTSKSAAEPISFTPFTLSALYGEKFEKAKWLAEDLIPIAGITALTGDSNTYKSFLTISLAISVATGQPFLGHFKVVKGKVLIVDEENHRSFIKMRFEQLGMDGSTDINFLSQKNIKFDNAQHITALKELLDKEAPTLVIFDSLVRFHNKKENDASEMSKVMDALRQMAVDNRAVVLIHHHRKEQGFPRRGGGQNVRGSGDIFASLDCHIAVDRKGQKEEVIMSQHKLRNQKQLAPFKVALLPTEDGGVTFSYQGQDTSRQDRVAETTESIKGFLASVDQPVTRKEIHVAVKESRGIVNDALKALAIAEEIVEARGNHGASLFQLKPETRITSDENEK